MISKKYFLAGLSLAVLVTFSLQASAPAPKAAAQEEGWGSYLAKRTGGLLGAGWLFNQQRYGSLVALWPLKRTLSSDDSLPKKAAKMAGYGVTGLLADAFLHMDATTTSSSADLTVGDATRNLSSEIGNLGSSLWEPIRKPLHATFRGVGHLLDLSYHVWKKLPHRLDVLAAYAALSAGTLIWDPEERRICITDPLKAVADAQGFLAKTDAVVTGVIPALFCHMPLSGVRSIVRSLRNSPTTFKKYILGINEPVRPAPAPATPATPAPAPVPYPYLVVPTAIQAPVGPAPVVMAAPGAPARR